MFGEIERIAEGNEDWKIMVGVAEDATGLIRDWLVVDDNGKSFLREVLSGLAFLVSSETRYGAVEITASLGNSDSHTNEALSQEVSIGCFFLSALISAINVVTYFVEMRKLGM